MPPLRSPCLSGASRSAPAGHRGTGGSLKDGVVEIQGEHVELLIDELLKRGFKAKKSGG